MLAAAASPQDMTDGIASHISILKLFPVEQLRNTTRASPLESLGGHVQVAVAEPPPTPLASDDTAQRPYRATVLAPREELAHRYCTPVVAPRGELRKRAAPAAPLAAPPPAKTAVAGSPRGAAKKKITKAKLSWTNTVSL